MRKCDQGMNITCLTVCILHVLKLQLHCCFWIHNEIQSWPQKAVIESHTFPVFSVIMPLGTKKNENCDIPLEVIAGKNFNDANMVNAQPSCYSYCTLNVTDIYSYCTGSTASTTLSNIVLTKADYGWNNDNEWIAVKFMKIGHTGW